MPNGTCGGFGSCSTKNRSDIVSGFGTSLILLICSVLIVGLCRVPNRPNDLRRHVRKQWRERVCVCFHAMIAAMPCVTVDSIIVDPGIMYVLLANLNSKVWTGSEKIGCETSQYLVTM